MQTYIMQVHLLVYMLYCALQVYLLEYVLYCALQVYPVVYVLYCVLQVSTMQALIVQRYPCTHARVF